MEEEHLTKFDLGDLEQHLMETDDFTIFNQDDLPMGGFQVMEDIRRKGKLCDVTLKVGQHHLHTTHRYTHNTHTYTYCTASHHPRHTARPPRLIGEAQSEGMKVEAKRK